MSLDDLPTPEEHRRAVGHVDRIRHRALRRRRLQAAAAAGLLVVIGLSVGLPLGLNGSSQSSRIQIIGGLPTSTPLSTPQPSVTPLRTNAPSTSPPNTTPLTVAPRSTASPPTTSTPATSSPTSSTTTPTTAPSSAPTVVPSGDYVDGQAGTPHYVLTVATTSAGFSGWMFFVYQDGHTSELFHYHADWQSQDTLTVHTDSTTLPFPFYDPPPYPEAGSQPISPGRSLPGTYHDQTLTLTGCSSYLYWADPSNTARPSSCSFGFNGNTIQ